MVQRRWGQTISRVCCIPQRYVFSTMGFLGVANAYIMRACLSIAITQMVVQPPVDNHTSTEEVCPYENGPPSNSSSHSTTKGEFDWDEQTQGLILSAFYWGYIITHIPGGLLAERFGGKHTLGLGLLSTSVFTLLTPLIAHQGASAMIALRFFMGLGEGTTFPALSTMLAQWAPPTERSKLSAVVFAGVQMGTVIASALSGIILQYDGWPSVFYIFGGVGLVWFAVWCVLCYNDPSSHPFITEQERAYLQETIGETKRKENLGGTPWKAMATSAPLWALTIAEVGHDYGLYTMVTDLPKYMSDVMHFNISSNGLLSALPYLVMWMFSIVMGHGADVLIRRKLVRITRLRRILASIGAVGPAIGVIAASYAGCDKTAVSVLFTVGMGLMGFCYASLRVNSLDLSPNYAGTIMAIVNGSGSLSGMVAPYVVGVLTPNRTLMEWRVVFWVMFGVLVSTNTMYMVFGSGEVQEWNEPIPKAVQNGLDRRRSTISGGEPIREKFKNYYPTSSPSTVSKIVEETEITK